MAKKNWFKQIKLKFWIWIALALLFVYFILNLTMGQIVWIIIIILIGTAIIQSVHKSSMGDYWKISWTILGIVGILVLVFFSVKSFSLENSPEGRVKIALEEKGYEVLDVWYFDDGDSLLYPSASVDMKSFGDLNEQAEEGLTTLSLYIKNASRYSVTIFTPTSKCYYLMDGVILNADWNTYKDGVWNTDPNTRIESEDVIKVKNSPYYQIWESYVKSGNASFNSVYLYENLDKTGITRSVLSSVLDYHIEQETESCS